VEGASNNKALKAAIILVLDDAPRVGAPCKFTPEQDAFILALSCEPPADSGREITHWTSRELADEAVSRAIVTSISPATVRRLLEGNSVKPHKSKAWLNRGHVDPESFKLDVERITKIYKDAPDLARRGIHVVCTDEKTGIQALEPLHLTLPVRPGLVERREQDYTRHGTLCLISNFNVASGLIITPSILQTRKNVDFAKHVATTVATDPDAIWIFVVDQLNVHKSEELVRFVAEECGICIDLGKKGKRGILRNQITRKAFLEDESHRIRFISTPKHCSWLNQVEIWFSILSRKLLKRGTFTSISDLEQKIQKFIEYYNKTMAKAFKWTYTGRPLATA